MNDPLRRLLDGLEARLDAGAARRTRERHLRALRWEETDRPPLVLQYPIPDACPFHPFPYREAFADPEKMLFNELLHAFETSIYLNASVGDDLPFTVRANCGTVVMASMFGCRVKQVEDNPPWALPMERLEDVERVLDMPPDGFERGLCPKVESIYAFYGRALAGYPNLSRCVRIVLPDLQGPMDTAELLRGCPIYTDLYERPDFVRRLLAHLARAQAGFARRLRSLITDSDDAFSHQHATVIRGRVLIRDDSPINMSAAMYEDVVAEHDEHVLRELGGGGIHFCGRGEHLVPAMLKLPSLACIDMGQPEMNDVDAVFDLARERRIAVVRVRVPEDQIASGRVRERFPTGVSLIHQCESMQAARDLWHAYTTRCAARQGHRK
jgi:hypothetical protein